VEKRVRRSKYDDFRSDDGGLVKGVEVEFVDW
jgi:hypothetical protein